MSVLLMKQLVKRIARVERRVANADPDAVKKQIGALETALKALGDSGNPRFVTSLAKQVERLRRRLKENTTDRYAEEFKHLRALYDFAKNNPAYQSRRGRRRAARKEKRGEA